ncbi:hypothetical protein EYF80_030965 [Liparis tanakae]|uniref:Uncharacterized protein n=1 Tax=Liparis tanakae TaxID=230148 RepID=A0A4Z2GZ64_9TELE|nr:hypothetical protein EYF80_030965 [Liparis tanakae]
MRGEVGVSPTGLLTSIVLLRTLTANASAADSFISPSLKSCFSMDTAAWGQESRDTPNGLLPVGTNTQTHKHTNTQRQRESRISRRLETPPEKSTREETGGRRDARTACDSPPNCVYACLMSHSAVTSCSQGIGSWYCNRYLEEEKKKRTCWSPPPAPHLCAISRSSLVSTLASAVIPATLQAKSLKRETRGRVSPEEEAGGAFPPRLAPLTR